MHSSLWLVFLKGHMQSPNAPDFLYSFPLNTNEKKWTRDFQAGQSAFASSTAKHNLLQVGAVSLLPENTGGRTDILKKKRKEHQTTQSEICNVPKTSSHEPPCKYAELLF